MGLLVMVFMMGQGFFLAPLIGFVGAFFGCVVSTRIMQHFVIRNYPEYLHESAIVAERPPATRLAIQSRIWLPRKLPRSRSSSASSTLSLDGGRTGVDVGIAIIPGVLIISTLVMILTFGPSSSGAYTGAAYEGIEILLGSHPRSILCLSGSSDSMTPTSWHSPSLPSVPWARPSASCPTS